MAVALLVWLGALAGSRSATAGGGPENVFLVVNQLSDDSKTIANHYIRWRNLPDRNVLHLSWRGNQETASVTKFRNQLLRPVLQVIDKRKLARQIDYVAYSSGFPWRIDMTKEFAKESFPPELRPVASLTGATYLWRFVMAKSPGIVGPTINWYVPQSGDQNVLRCRDIAGVPSRGFRTRYRWERGGGRAPTARRAEGPPVGDRPAETEPDGAPPAKGDTPPGPQGQRYLLCTMLGVTTGRGNSVAEVLDYLQRAAQADRTQPRGTFYFMRNNDIRSKTRHACFDGVVEALRAEGAQAVVMTGTAPRAVTDIAGLTVGAVACDLASAGSSVLPGAICEHLTSFGGVLSSKPGTQMPLTAFLRRGAAGASGTVIEPRAIQAKFPLPTIHLHYRRGCSLAEAFYQSVAGPYQLLVVGDPLCQPWARPPRVLVPGLAPGAEVRGEWTVTPHILPPTHAGDPPPGPEDSEPRPVEIYIDGLLVARVPSGKPVKLDTAKLPQGHHELRVVAAGRDAIEARGRVVASVMLANDPNDTLVLTVSPAPVIAMGEEVKLTARSPRLGETVVFQHAGRELGRAELKSDPAAAGRASGPQGVASLRVPAVKLGRGPVRLRAQLATGTRAAPVWRVIK